jgi:hypothetical protein
LEKDEGDKFLVVVMWKVEAHGEKEGIKRLWCWQP